MCYILIRAVKEELQTWDQNYPTHYFIKTNQECDAGLSSSRRSHKLILYKRHSYYQRVKKKYIRAKEGDRP